MEVAVNIGALPSSPHVGVPKVYCNEFILKILQIYLIILIHIGPLVKEMDILFEVDID